jgi:hypothetical protein
MKKLTVATILLAFLWSCKKEVPGIDQKQSAAHI